MLDFNDTRTYSLATACSASRFIQIPGPNPLLTPGPPGSWDEGVIEACDMLKDHDTYYLYYHGTSSQSGYQVGVATANHPLGPFSKYGSGPVLPLGPAGSWDETGTACAFVLKEGANRYTMWYSARSDSGSGKWSIGLATADNPLGPWTKHAANPVLEDFGYVGGVAKLGDTYYLYTEHPIGATGPDYGPISLAVAQRPEGPWMKREEPVLQAGDWGEWDDGGFSEARVYRCGGAFHIFYGGAKLNPTRILTRESIGYAYSFDGVNFIKHAANPVATREASPDAAAFAEVHAYPEPPFIYLYHTLRYNSREGAEDVGVQVLATQQPFRLTMPLFSGLAIGAGQTTDLAACPPLSLAAVRECAFTVETQYGETASRGLRLHVRASHDGLAYDTADLHTWDLSCHMGETVRQTFTMPAEVMFVKVLVENRDPAQAAREVSVWATVGG